MKTTMRTGNTCHLTLMFMVTVFVCQVMSQSCNITNIYDNGNEDKYFATELDNYCYILDLREENAERARTLCRNGGGHLTDINERNYRFLQSVIKNVSDEDTDFNSDYWIGLLWNEDFKWYWDNGANFIDREGFDEDSTGRCGVLQTEDEHFEWNNQYCYKDNYFICKIPPPDGHTCAQQNKSTENSNKSCPICAAALQKRVNASPLPPMTTTAAPLNTTENVTSTTNVTNVDERKSGGNENGGATGCQTGTEEKEAFSCDRDIIYMLILPAVLGAVLVFSVLINIALVCVLVRRGRKYRTSKMKDKKAVPMVDILNVDKEPRSPGETSQLCSTDEILYANDNGYDDRKKLQNDKIDTGGQSSKNEKNYDSMEDENNLYNNTNDGKGNTSGTKGAAMAGPNYSQVTPTKSDKKKGVNSTPNYTEPVKTAGEKFTTNSESEKPRYMTMTSASSRNEGNMAESDTTYSTLNRNGDQREENLESSAVGHVYGIHSASAPFAGSDASQNTEVLDTGSRNDSVDEYSKLNRGEHSTKTGDPQHVYGLESMSGPLDDAMDNKEQVSEYESYT